MNHTVRPTIKATTCWVKYKYAKMSLFRWHFCLWYNLLPMPVKFINPQGRLNEAFLSVEQVEKLKRLEGYIVLEQPKVRISISDSVCTACEA
jgi:hypothetical protein